MNWYGPIHSESSFTYAGRPQECVVLIAVGLQVQLDDARVLAADTVVKEGTGDEGVQGPDGGPAPDLEVHGPPRLAAICPARRLGQVPADT